MNMGVLSLSISVILATVLSVSANNISEQCHVHNEWKIMCSCIGNEELYLPEDYDYSKVTSVTVTGCASVNLHYASMPEAVDLEELIVQNTGYLDFRIFITSNRMKLLKLADIGRIPLIPEHTFVTITSIEEFQVENVHIVEFEEDFSTVQVSNFVVKNVTIDHVDRLNLSENSQMLYIAQSSLRNITTSLNFANVENIEIVDSVFELWKPGLLSVQGNNVIVSNSIFTNASMNLVAVNFTSIHGICADGKSTLRLSSKYIHSINNRLPNEIAYPTMRDDAQESRKLVRYNNTVCKAGNCKCLKSRGQAPRETRASLLLLVFLLTASLYRISA